MWEFLNKLNNLIKSCCTNKNIHIDFTAGTESDSNLIPIYTIKFAAYKDVNINSKQVAYCATLYRNGLAIMTDIKISNKCDLFFNYIDFYGLELGLNLALKYKIENIIIQTSNQVVISTINDIMYINSSFIKKTRNNKIICKIKKLEKKFNSIDYKLILVDDNKVLQEIVKKKLYEIN